MSGAPRPPNFSNPIALADERFTAELEPLLASVAVPTFVVWGRQDTWIPPDRAQRLAAMIPDCRVEIVAAAGHLIQEDQPATLNALLAGWLAAR